MGSKWLKLIALGVLIPAGLLAVKLPVYAHTLAKDGKISAFLHIAPDDKPLPGKINTVHFYFNDQDFRFSMDGCVCNVSVKEGQRSLYEGILPAEDTRVGKINVLLPDNNFSYDVVVSGTPKAAGFFQPFKLKFDIDVGNPPPKEPAKRNPWLLVTVAGLIIVAAVAAFYSFKRKAKIKAHKEE